PALSDVFAMCEVLSTLGAAVSYQERTLRICCSGICCRQAQAGAMKKLRASFLVSGPMLARCGHIATHFPGGCAIGSRPVDLHLAGFAALGAAIKAQDGMMTASADKLKGALVHLAYPSVGATENIMMAACLAQGSTVIRNAAEEPEVEDLADLLRKMGAKIYGAGSSVICIEGVNSLSSAKHTPIPDRIEAGTLIIATAITGGNTLVQNVVPEHLKPLLITLKEAGAHVLEYPHSIRVMMQSRLRAVDIKVMPFPGYPTDLQAQYMALCSLSEGRSIIEETVFEDRFRHVQELIKMGAKIGLRGNMAVVDGISALKGAKVKATDLRAGAAMVLAGLAATGETVIEEAAHIDRGHENLDGMLCALGAKIERGCLGKGLRPSSQTHTPRDCRVAWIPK
ncbi:MAG: UDP-N-acetylglucosamine 1-carboxyvinyltransferase, partial [Bacillota bacterium]|nr:UDP-N-acetylglucosamine 1-carboxyvinyltransferase [Bacillota bacterium]